MLASSSTIQPIASACRPPPHCQPPGGRIRLAGGRFALFEQISDLARKPADGIVEMLTRVRRTYTTGHDQVYAVLAPRCRRGTAASVPRPSPGLRPGKKGIVDQAAERIYDVRCRIVYAKDAGEASSRTIGHSTGKPTTFGTIWTSCGSSPTRPDHLRAARRLGVTAPTNRIPVNRARPRTCRLPALGTDDSSPPPPPAGAARRSPPSRGAR